MASYTTNLNLKKPAGSENVAIGDINNNMDAIDAAYGTLNSSLNKKPDYFTTTLSANTSKTLTLSNNSRAVLYTIGSSDTRNTEYLIYASSTGTVVATGIKTAQDVVTLDTSVNNKLSITSMVNNGLYLIIFAGSITE